MKKNTLIMWGDESQIPIINNILGEIYQPGYNHNLYTCFKEKHGEEIKVYKNLWQIYSFLYPITLFKASFLSPPFVIMDAIVIVLDHWDKIDNQEKYKDEFVSSNDMENYAVTDGYLSFSMHDYDAYNNITYDNPQELKENHKVIRVTIGRWGKLDYSDMIVYDNNERRFPTVDEYNYYNGKFDSALDYYMFGIL